MAKKKSKANKAMKQAEPKAQAKKEKSSSAGWIVGVIIVIVIIVVILLLLRGCSTETDEQTQPTVEAPKTEAPAKEDTATGPKVVSDIPEIVRYCKEEYAIGWPETQIANPCTLDGNGAQVSLEYSGNGDSLPGLFFEVKTVSGTVTYLKDTRKIIQGDIMVYDIPDIGGKIDSMLALPMIKEDGQDKACLNQRLIVIKATNCVRS